MQAQDPAWLDRMYNNRELVPDHPAYLARWAAESAAARDDLVCRLDLHYGPAPHETLDVFPATQRRAPVLFFMHGGYWRSLDKRDHSFIARRFVQAGVCVVIPNYALCPGTPDQPVGIDTIALEMVRALCWTWHHIRAHGGDPDRITVAGHSAGGHLAAMLLGCDWRQVAPELPAQVARNAMSISGLHDLRPIAQTPFLQEALRLTPEQAQRLSPALWDAPEGSGPLYAMVGGAESEEFRRQNQLIRDAWGEAAVPVCEEVPGRHHFSVLDALVDPEQALHARALELLQR